MNGLPFEFSVRGRQMTAMDDVELAHAVEDRDTELENFLALRLGTGTWSNPLRMSSHYLWIDATGDLRIESSTPTSDFDGTVVGTQA